MQRGMYIIKGPAQHFHNTEYGGLIFFVLAIVSGCVSMA